MDFKFQDRHIGQDVCRKPEAGSEVKLAKKLSNCPKECTTKVKLYENEYSFQNDELKLEPTFKDKDVSICTVLAPIQAAACNF